MITGKRKTEASLLKWKDVDFETKGGVKTLTLYKTKNKKPDIIPMTKLMFHLLKYRSEAPHKHKDWVFPNRFGSAPIDDIRKSSNKITPIC